MLLLFYKLSSYNVPPVLDFLTLCSVYAVHIQNNPHLVGSNKGKRDSIVLLQLDFHLYTFNWRFENLQWGLQGREGAYAIPASLAKRLSVHKQHSKSTGYSIPGATIPLSPNTPAEGSTHNTTPTEVPISASGIRRLLRSEHRQLLLKLAAEYNIVFWRASGWHLSQFYSPAEMVNSKYMNGFPSQKEETLKELWNEDVCQIVQVSVFCIYCV